MIPEKTLTDFQDIFNTRLCKFYNPVTGFDVIAFDRFIGTPDGISMEQWIKREYGERGLNLIVDLLKVRP